MFPEAASVLAINGGSSGVKFALYRDTECLSRVFHGKIDRGDAGEATLTLVSGDGPREETTLTGIVDDTTLAKELMDRIDRCVGLETLRAAGHRIVHAMQSGDPEPVTPRLLEKFRGLVACDPEHLPLEIALIEALAHRRPAMPQVVCFDSAFHRTMPRVASILPLPRRLELDGIRRYGFHGISCAYVMEELVRLGDSAASEGRVIIAHLGSGASLTAVLCGRSIDTSMGFTPAAGLPMSTRAGDLDPGLVGHLARTRGMSAEMFHTMINLESGLLGVSETSADMRRLLELENSDVRAAEAVALFCYGVKKTAGGYAAVLGGLDTLVFTGGIGENSPAVRSRACAGLAFLGIELDEGENTTGAGLISSEKSRVKVRVIRTDEERMIARAVAKIYPRDTRITEA